MGYTKIPGHSRIPPCWDRFGVRWGPYVAVFLPCWGRIEVILRSYPGHVWITQPSPGHSGATLGALGPILLPSGLLGVTRCSCVSSSASRPETVQKPWRGRVGVAPSWARLDVIVRGLRPSWKHVVAMGRLGIACVPALSTRARLFILPTGIHTHVSSCEFPRKLLLEPSLSEPSHVRSHLGSRFTGGGWGSIVFWECTLLHAIRHRPGEARLGQCVRVRACVCVCVRVRTRGAPCENRGQTYGQTWGKPGQTCAVLGQTCPGTA